VKIVSLRSASLFLFAVISSSIAQPVNYNPIDAVTSASTRLQIKSGKAFADSAQITWWDYYSNGDIQTIKYGTSTAYGSTINLQPFTEKTDITTTIPNLLPNTTYFYQFYRFYEDLEHTTDGSFTTFGNGGIGQTKPKVALTFDLRGKKVEVYLPSGKLVASIKDKNIPVKKMLGYSLIRNLGLKSGVYLFTVKNNQTDDIIFTTRQACFR
jgi:hypothetical protein